MVYSYQGLTERELQEQEGGGANFDKRKGKDVCVYKRH